MGLSDRIAYSGNRNTVTTETNRAKQCQVTHLRTTRLAKNCPELSDVCEAHFRDGTLWPQLHSAGFSACSLRLPCPPGKKPSKM